jgi:hypothetical protein
VWRRWLAILAIATLVITIIAVAEVFSLAAQGYPNRHSDTHNQYQPIYALTVQLLLGGWRWISERITHDTITTAAIVATALFTGTLWRATGYNHEQQQREHADDKQDAAVQVAAFIAAIDHGVGRLI